MAFSSTTAILLLTLLSLLHSTSSSSEAYFPVANFGAKADGKTDSTHAFLAAWAAACQSVTPAVVYAPVGKFLLGTVIFNGPCQNSGIGFRVDGTLLAISDYYFLEPSDTWIMFDYVHGLSIYGGGTLNGHGAAFWACKADDNRKCPDGAKSLSIGHSSNVKVSGLKSINSKFFHIFIWGSNKVNVEGCYLIAPGNSPNTDGIHVQQSSNITITSSYIMTGDDCISIGPGTSNVWVESIFCGPGHGISIGSLGQSREEPGVQNVTVKTVAFYETTNGVRIKTWGRPSNGYAKNVTFQHLTMSNVTNPIIVDQNYCPSQRGCPNQNSGITISEVLFSNVRGTSATPVAISLDCSPSKPCRGIQLQDINLTYKKKPAMASCNYVFGRSLSLKSSSKCI